MKLRETLVESKVAAVSIALLMLWSIDATFEAAWPFISRAGMFVFIAAAIQDIPYHSWQLNAWDRLLMVEASSYLGPAVGCALAAMLVSRCIYGSGPFRAMTVCYSKIKGGKKCLAA